MDIAKIRKKAQSKDKEKKIAGQDATAPKDAKAKDEKTEIQNVLQETAAPAVAIEGKFEIFSSEQKAELRKEDTEDSADNVDDLLELLTFSLSKEEFAFRISNVEEIVKFQKISKVPTMPGYVLGITSLRGKLMPVIDLKTRLNLKMENVSEDDSDTQIAAKSGTVEKILIISGPKGLIGATIDKVLGVIRLPHKKVLEPPSHLTEAELKFIEGVVIFEKRFISIIRPEDTMDIEVS